MSEHIIIKQDYFNNIKVAIDSLNEFFTSGFKVKNFPAIDGDFVLEPTIERIISRLNCVDPTWMEDPNKMNDVINMISENLKNIDPVDGVYQTIVNSNNKTMIDAIDSYIGFKMIQLIADNFQDFGKFVNGIYTFELFTKTSQYTDVLDVFNQFIQFDELPELDLEEKIFDEGFYVDGLMKMSQIEFPPSMTIETETDRIINRHDLTDIDVFVDDSVQEAAEVNYFENTKPAHMKYSDKSSKLIISKEFEKVVNDLVSGLRNCDTTDDLIKYFNELPSNAINKIPTVVMPFIFTKVITNKKKFKGNISTESDVENYTKSYDSIIEQNNGAKRFQNYDLFSTFKTDKDGTIQFIEDFMKLKLINDPEASIANNTLLTIFNIFDSRIYLDIAYNVLPDDKKKEQTEDAYVKEIRARINKNSRTNNAYKETDTVEEKADNNESVTEYVSKTLKEYRDATISDMLYCEQYYDMVMREIDTFDNRVYNANISPFAIDAYIGESYDEINNHLDDVFVEANIHKRRETLQSAVSSLISEMERIVSLDNKHQWNNNTFVHSYRTTTDMFVSLFPNITGSSKAHTDIKQVYFCTNKAIKGKSGNFTPEQRNALTRLHSLVEDLWLNVKIFWINPLNMTKRANLFNNDKKDKRVKNIARIARSIVAMKGDLEFLQSDDFVTEAWYDGSSDYVFQEATTEENHRRINLAIKLLMEDMKSVVELSKKKMWTNNACINKFKTATGTHGRTRSEAYTNLKQAIKYVNRGISGSCGKFKDGDKSTLKSLLEKLEDMQKAIRVMNFNITTMLGSNIKESSNAHKIATLANDIVGMESELEFLKSAPVKDTGTDNAESSSDDESVQESYNLHEFIMEEWNGEIPEYMKTRLKMSDDIGKEPREPEIAQIDVPRDIPQNDIGQLGDSINSRLDAGGELGDMLGSGFDNNPNKEKVSSGTVINITNNYTNSFNKDSNNTTTTKTTVDDHSSGKVTNTTDSNNKTNSDNDNSHDNKIDKSERKSSSNTSRKSSNTDNSDRSSTSTKGSNNNNNSNGSDDPKDSSNIIKKDNEQKLSSGKTIQEMFMFLESKEPQSFGSDAGKPPKEDSLTKAMDRDRKSLATQQKVKKGLQKVANTGKAVLKPVSRAKQWLRKQVDSLIRRDEDQVKADIIENKSYRSAVFKAMHLALDLGMIGLAFTIQPFLGVFATGLAGLKMVDKNRLKKEAQREIESEIKVCEEKINDLNSMNTPAARKEKYEYMRMKSFLENQLTEVYKSPIKHPRNTW